jgi:molybdopterin molybdotransferase
LKECDFLLLSGGVSKGDYDYVPEVLERAGVKIHFHGVKVKPGRPTLFGRTDDTLVFGLPGNPVSVFVIFETLVRPLLNRIQGAPPPGIEIRGRLTKPVKRRDTERAEFLPVSLETDEAGVLLTPVRYGGSSHLNALADAEALIGIPAGTARLEAGAIVDARLL